MDRNSRDSWKPTRIACSKWCATSACRRCVRSGWTNRSFRRHYGVRHTDRCVGLYVGSFVHLDRFDAMVGVDAPVTEYLHPKIGEVAERVARYIASIIGNGSTLQIGLGRVPNEALRYLTDRRDLGIHSDVITDGVVDLVEAGVVTGRRKTRHRDRIVASYCLGTRPCARDASPTRVARTQS